jgi:hypothetical protein
MQDWEFGIVEWDAFSNGFHRLSLFHLSKLVKCKLACYFSSIILLKEKAEVLWVVIKKCRFEECLKISNWAVAFDDFVDNRKSIILMILQPLNIPIDKLIKSQLRTRSTCITQNVVLLDIFFQEKIGFPEFLNCV